MSGRDFNEVVEKIIEDDPRFDRAAYHFMRRALDHTLKQLHSGDPERDARHVSGQELLDGIRDFSLKEFGPLTYTVLTNWGLKKSGDFGEIVFNLVDWGVFGKTDDDSREDFRNGYDFKDAFLKPFEP